MAFEIENPSEKKSLLFGIVTYKEKYWECDSFICLVESFKQYKSDEEDLYIFIVDNTDVENWNIQQKYNEENINLKYINLKNPGISVAYNKVIDHANRENFRWVVFLDQDTKLPLDSYQKYKKESLQNNINNPIKIP
jgi:GT2 family glycosyltransferase